jgi:hypothetical protein
LGDLAQLFPVSVIRRHAWRDGIAKEACRELLAETGELREANEQLYAELTRLRAHQLATPMSWVEPRNTAAAIEQAIAWTAVLSDWERGFITSIASRRFLSEKQRDCLEKIIWKIERYARAKGIAA